MTSHRIEKMSSLFTEALALVLKTEIRDPRLSDVILTEVTPTPDLKLLRAYYIASDTSDINKKEIVAGFKKSKSYLRKRLGEEIELRFVPDLEFFYDEGYEARNRVEALFDVIKKKG